MPAVLSHPLVQDADLFAEQAHRAQGQLYNGEPYSVHTRGVALRVAAYIDCAEVVAAAHLHDILEDTEITFEVLAQRFGEPVATLVFEVTKQKPPGPSNRAGRAAFEAARLAGVSSHAKSIKCADVAENMQGIVETRPYFARTYVPEKRALLRHLQGANPDLLRNAELAVEAVERQLASVGGVPKRDPKPGRL